MTSAERIADWAERLRHVAAEGLMYTENLYDRQHYETVQRVALEMMALATDAPPDHIDQLRRFVFSRPGPLVTGDAAVIDDSERVLLIKRAQNQCWALPGGFLAVGETPAEGVVREVHEETGITCEPVRLAGIYDSRRSGYSDPHHLYCLSFLCRPLSTEPDEASHANEILEQGWFREDELPEPLDAGFPDRIAHAFKVLRGGDPRFD
jgi:ADP-ribose pyrophosphatase YjhB (NUDIX family)